MGTEDIPLRQVPGLGHRDPTRAQPPATPEALVFSFLATSSFPAPRTFIHTTRVSSLAGLRSYWRSRGNKLEEGGSLAL